MKLFWRAFEYVWPQWPRLIVVFVTAIVVGVLFSFSIATVSPLLKVMMNEEGLHGWVNRKICEARYGLSFWVPDRSEYSDPNNADLAFYLQITGIDRDGKAEQAGLLARDRIVAVGDEQISEGGKVPSSVLLKTLVMVPQKGQVRIRYKRLDESNRLTTVEETLQAGKRPFYSNAAQSLLKLIPDAQTRAGKRDAVVYIMLFMLLVTLCRCLARYFQVYTVNKIMNIVLAELREDAFRHAMNTPVGFFDKEGASDTVSRLVRDMILIGSGIKVLLGKTLREPLKALAMLIMAFWIDHNLTLVFLCGAPVSLFMINKLGRKIKRATKKSLESWALMLGKLKESLGAVKVIKVYNRQQHESKLFDSINKRLLKQQFHIAKIEASTGPIMESLGMMAGTVGLICGAHWVYGGTMQPSDFFVLLVLLGATAESVRKTSDVWNKLQQANTAAERVYAIIDREPEQEQPGAYEIGPLRERIEFQDICFSYPGVDRMVLNKINLSVEAGHNVAIVGPNGSGKTTLANLIPRFYDPDSGRILIDGKDIRGATFHSLRDQIGMVTQNVTTFHDTIAGNIAYGKPNASEEEIVVAAKRAFAHEFVEPLENGYDTVIGEQGAGLSGGQLQRIVIARALLKNPAILIFDEATSQVDADSEAKIHRAIEEIMQDRTSFIIAHRFSTVISADIIVVMDEGHIVAQGHHKELIESCRLYQSLYETQLVKA